MGGSAVYAGNLRVVCVTLLEQMDFHGNRKVWAKKFQGRVCSRGLNKPTKDDKFKATLVETVMAKIKKNNKAKKSKKDSSDEDGPDDSDDEKDDTESTDESASEQKAKKKRKKEKKEKHAKKAKKSSSEDVDSDDADDSDEEPPKKEVKTATKGGWEESRRTQRSQSNCWMWRRTTVKVATR